MFAWSQLDFSAIPASISAVSLTSRQTWQNVNSKRRLQRIQNIQERKKHQKKETSGCFCLFSFVFWGEVSNSWILNDIDRNFLLGKRKKLAKCLMRTFTCRSTFLYDSSPGICFPIRSIPGGARRSSIHLPGCNVSLSPTDVSSTENSWMLHPLDKVSLGYFAPDRTIPSLCVAVLCVGRACIRRRGANPINLVRGVGEAGQTPHWSIRCRRPTELVACLMQSRVGTHWSGAQYPRDALFKGRNIQEFSVGDTSVGGTSTLCAGKRSRVGKNRLGTHPPRGASYMGRIVPKVHRLRDASSRGCTLLGTHRPRDWWSQQCMGTVHTGTHFHGISVLPSVCTLWPNRHLQAISAATEYRGGGHFEQWLEERQLPPQVLLLSHKDLFICLSTRGTESSIRLHQRGANLCLTKTKDEEVL